MSFSLESQGYSGSGGKQQNQWVSPVSKASLDTAKRIFSFLQRPTKSEAQRVRPELRALQSPWGVLSQARSGVSPRPGGIRFSLKLSFELSGCRANPGFHISPESQKPPSHVSSSHLVHLGLKKKKSQLRREKENYFGVLTSLAEQLEASSHPFSTYPLPRGT